MDAYARLLQLSETGELPLSILPCRTAGRDQRYGPNRAGWGLPDL
ncbi:hypothetical protein [Streptomyces ipomoeae]|nr:hypothetical protein [Streptomyces ipomoeae]